MFNIMSEMVNYCAAQTEDDDLAVHLDSGHVVSGIEKDRMLCSVDDLLARRSTTGSNCEELHLSTSCDSLCSFYEQ
jgi:hypothetical protein